MSPNNFVRSRSHRHLERTGHFSQRGSVIVESALCLLAFLMVVFAIMDFSRAVSAYNILSGAAREGTRYAVVHGKYSGAVASSSDVSNSVKKWALGLNPQSLTTTTTWTPDNKPGSTVKVQVVYSFSPLTPAMPKKAFTLKATSQMVILQ